MTMTLTSGALLAGMLAGPCPPADEPPFLIDRKALQEIMIHDAHGGNLDGRSILGVIFELPIGLRYAVDGKPLPEGDPDAVMAVELEAMETAWVVGTGEEASTIHLVRRGSDAPEAGGRCIDLMTLPLDPEYIAQFEALGGPGTPGMGLHVLNTVVLSHAANLAMSPAQRRARSTRTVEVRIMDVRVAAPWLRDHEEYRDQPGLRIMRGELRGDAREIFPHR
jgi:hypothetical protein